MHKREPTAVHPRANFIAQMKALDSMKQEETPTDLEFSSNFESGNLNRAYKM